MYCLSSEHETIHFQEIPWMWLTCLFCRLFRAVTETYKAISSNLCQEKGWRKGKSSIFTGDLPSWVSKISSQNKNILDRIFAAKQRNIDIIYHPSCYLSSCYDSIKKSQTLSTPSDVSDLLSNGKFHGNVEHSKRCSKSNSHRDCRAQEKPCQSALRSVQKQRGWICAWVSYSSPDQHHRMWEK